MSKIPLEVKIFMWCLRRGVVLTRDNIARRNWQGSKKCSFCTHDETIKHLFFWCKFARSTWSVIQIEPSLYPATSVANIFGHWLDGISNRFRTQIRVGVIALLWALWLCRNNLVFEGKNSSPLQVIFHCTHFFLMSSMLHRTEYETLFKTVCTWLERVARFFTQHGWQHNLRIGPPPDST
jgi:hypothetical protein